MTEETNPENNEWLVDEDTSVVKSNQFSVRSILWLMAAFGLYLGYATWLGPKEVARAVLFALVSSGIGVLLGLLNRRLIDTLFWSMLVAMLAYLAVAGGQLQMDAVYNGWGVAGALSGGISVFEKPRAYWCKGLLMGGVSGLAMFLMIRLLQGPLTILLWVDVASAFVVGGLLAPFIGFLNWFERESRQPRIVLAAWLTISVLIGNMLVPVLAGVTR